MSGESRPERPRRSGPWRLIRRAIVVLVLFVAGVLIALHIPFVQRAIVRMAVARLQAPLGASIEYQSVRFNLVTRTLDVTALRFGAPGAEPLVTADRVHVHYPWPAYRGKLDGLDVTLEGAHVALVQQGGHWITIPSKWLGGPPSPNPRPLPAFAALRLHGVDVRYEDRDAGFGADTTGIRVDLLPDPGGEAHQLVGAITPGATTRVSWEPRATTLRVVSGRARYAPTHAGVDALKLDAREGEISSDVTFAFHGSDRLQLHASGTLKGETLETWVPLLETLRGPLAVDFTMPAAGGAPAFADVRLQGAGVSWRGVSIRNIQARGALDTRGISLADTTVAVGGGTASGRGRLAWADAGESNAVLAFRNLDAGSLWRTLLAGSRGALWVAPASLVSGRFEGRWAGWHAAALDGRVATTWTPRPSGPARDEHLWLDGDITARFARGPWTIGVKARADSALDLDGTVTTRGSRADYADWPLDGRVALRGETSPVLIDGLRLAGLDERALLHGATGALSGDATLSRTFGTARTDLTIDSALAWPDQPRVDMHLRAAVDSSALVVDEWRATSGPSSADATATLDFDRDTIQASFTGRDVPIEAWTRRFDLGTPATGHVALDGTVTGALADPRIEARITGGPLMAYGQILGTLDGRVAYQDGTLRADPLTLAAKDGGTLTLQGRWAHESGEVDATLGAQSVHLGYDLPGLVNEAGEPAGRVRTAVSGTAHVTGTTADPVVDASFDAPSLTLDGADLGALHARATTADRTVTLAASAPGLGATLDGSLGFEGDRPYAADLRVKTADAPIAGRAAGADFDIGAIDLSSHADGALGHDRVLSSARLEVRRFDATVMGLPLAMAPGARVTLTPDTLTAEHVDLAAGGAHLTVSGALDGTPDHRLEVRLKGAFEDLRPLAAHLLPPKYDTAVLDGTFEAGVTASNTLSEPAVVGTFTLDGTQIGDGVHPPATDVKVRASLDRKTLTLEVAELYWQGAHAELQGTVPAWFLGLPSAPQTGRASLTGHVDDVTLAVLKPFLEPDQLAATDFKVGVQYTVGADRPDPDAVVADVQITEAAITSRELGLQQQAPGHLTLRRRHVTLDPWTIGAPASAGTTLTLSGTADLTDTPSIDGKADGTLDLRAIGLLLGTYRPAGRATIRAAMTGPLSAPNLEGFVRLENGELTVRDPRLLFSNVQGTIRLNGSTVTLEDVTGTLNGGAIDATGSTSLPGRGQPQGTIAVTARGILFDVPKGFRSMVDADLTFEGRPSGRYQLGGTATIIDAAYREQLIVTGGLLSLFQPKSLATPVGPRASSSDRPWLQLNLRVLADDSIAIDTSYGQVAIGANLRVLGPPDNIRVLGQADIAPGGRFYLGGHTYQIESGRLDFVDPSSLVPEVHLSAQTTISGYAITMRIETSGGRTETTLSSDPVLPEEQIASLILSGQRQTSGPAGDVVTQQLVAALSGEITSAVGRAIGFDAVRIESGNPGDTLFDASLISADSNPAQRLTFSKRILPELDVIISQNLAESGQITWVVSWEPIRRFELRFVQLDNQDRSYEIRHDISFGGGVKAKRPADRPREKIRDIFVVSFGGVTEDDIRAVMRLKPGATFDFFKWQEDRDRVHALMVNRGFYEASITARRDPSAPPKGLKNGSPVDLGYTIETGPPTALVLRGMDVPDTVRKALVEAWTETPVSSLLDEEFKGILVPWLASRDYLRPTIETAVSDAGARTVATVTIDPGRQFKSRVITFRGNDGISNQELRSAISAAQIKRSIWSTPADLTPVLEDYYRSRGYLAVKVVPGQPQFLGDRAELAVTVQEGPLFKVGSVKVNDSGSEPPKGVSLTPPVEAGTVLSDGVVRAGIQDLQARYRSAGYRGTRVRAQSTAQPDGSTVNLVFTVTRGRRFTFGTLTVAGVEGKERNMVEQSMPFEDGEPVSLDDLSEARNRLYNTDLFRSVNIDVTPRTAPDGEEAPAVVDATVTVEPMPKYRLRYGFQLFDPHQPSVDPKWGSLDPGVVVDLTRRGLFGRGLTGGLSGRLNPSYRTARAYLSSREFLGHPLESNLYVSDEWQRAVELGYSLEARQRDVTYEQRVRLHPVQFSYGYNYERVNLDLLVNVPTLPFPIPVSIAANISRLITGAFLDYRDNAIDATKGWFHSSSLEFAPSWLGSTQPFRKYLGQQYLFLPVSKSAVLGSAARFEYASGPGQIFIITERLKAGGANTVRGYDDLSLSRLTSDGLGTEKPTSLLVLNEEFRFPLFWRLRGAAFWDHASFFGDVPLLDEQRRRNSVGAGVRLVLPFILLRVDYGYPLNKDPINTGGKWYFAIGQAF